MPFDSPPPEQSEKPKNTIQKILIADDQENNRYLLQKLLGGHGYQVISAENGQEALEIIKTEKVDAIISDILMPLMDGFQLCRTLKKDPELARIPFIFYTASYPEEEDRLFGLSLGAEEYISKPIEPDDFLVIIRKVFESVEQGETGSARKPPLDNLSYYTGYADILGKKHPHLYSRMD